MKTRNEAADDPLDKEIDFSNARPNPYFLGVVDRACVRVLEQDLAEIFPDDASVNAALRAIADAGKRARPHKVSVRSVAVSPSRGRRKS